MFEDNLNPYVHTMSTILGGKAHFYEFIDSIERAGVLKSQIEANNEAVRKFLKEKYSYEFCTTMLGVTVPALTAPETQE